MEGPSRTGGDQPSEVTTDPDQSSTLDRSVTSVSESAQRPLMTRRLIRAGVFGWAVVGLLLALWMVSQVASRVSLVILPLVIALFPAALLSPLSQWMKRRGLRPGLAAIIVVLTFLITLIGLVILLATLIAGELDQVFDSIREAYGEIRVWA
jgi:putative heme transporter